MKKIVVMALFFTFVGCQKDSDNSLTTDRSLPTTGNTTLSFEKSSIPSNISIISASLSRTGYTTITKSLYVLSDSTGMVEINNLQIGVWHIKVNAYDANDTVKYSGETDVNILEGIVTQVSLTLYPITNNQVGGVKITVTWKESQIVIDNPVNPILKLQGTFFDYGGIKNPVVFADSGIIRLYYMSVVTPQDSLGSTAIGMATSVNGISWTHYSQEPVITTTRGSWDETCISPGMIIKDGSVYKMYYNGYTNKSANQYKVGLATSFDGLTWQKNPQPVFTGTTGWEYSVATVAVIKVNLKYYMFYNGSPARCIGLATSEDGIHWTRHPNNPVLLPTELWEGNGIFNGSVIYEENLFKMVYANSTYSQSFGYATSKDGVNWEKSKNNPFFSIQGTNWGSVSIDYPFLTKIGNEYKIFYAALLSSNKWCIANCSMK